MSELIVIGPDGKARPNWATTPEYVDYYDNEWGNPVRDEAGLFERITLEAFQSGLSWLTILRKRPAFRAAFHDFDPEAVAAFDEHDVERLMNDEGIIRNRRKIDAAITNARATVALRAEGGLVDLVWSFQPAAHERPRTAADYLTQCPESVALSKALKQRGFVFVGPTTMYALMQAIGMVDDHPVGSWRATHETALNPGAS